MNAVLINTKFNDWTVIDYAPNRKNQKYVKAQCVCGMTKEVNLLSIKHNRSKSCGCESSKKIGDLNRGHNKYLSSEYKIWKAMKARCSDLENKYYGGKGIIVCEKWKNSFQSFIEDMGLKPLGYSIDRIDGNGNYEPNNCRWADKLTQIKNRAKYRTNA